MSAPRECRQGAASRRLHRIERAGLLLAALVLLGLLATARRLEPDPRGLGTHEQLGLASCAYRGWTGMRCPTCGMTTAFAWFVRGRLDRSWSANPGGCLLGACSAVLIPWFLACSGTGRPVWRARSALRPVLLIVLVAFNAGLVSGIVRLVLGRE